MSNLANIKEILPLSYYKKLNHLDIDIDEIEINQIKSGGKGGQKINKTAICIQLFYKPLDIHIKSKKSRDLSINLKKALIQFIDEAEFILDNKNSKKQIKIEKIRRKKSKSKKPNMQKKQNFLMLLSPSKSQDFETPISIDFNPPNFLLETFELIKILKDKSTKDIKNLMSISQNLAELNFRRFQNFTHDFDETNSKAALFAFTGDVYSGFQLETFDHYDLDYANDHLRIISGLYGLLRPLDFIKPYRLEMKTILANSKGKDLYCFWKEKLTREVQSIKPDFILNLASKEYSDAIDFKNLKIPIINFTFLKKSKAGEMKNIAIYAKKARGMMANYVIKNQIDKLEKLKSFNENGYTFDPKLSTEENLVFTLQ